MNARIIAMLFYLPTQKTTPTCKAQNDVQTFLLICAQHHLHLRDFHPCFLPALLNAPSPAFPLGTAGSAGVAPWGHVTHVVEGEDGDGHALHQHAGTEGLGHQVGRQAGDNAATQVRSPVKIWDRQDGRTKLLVTWTQLNIEEARWMWDTVATQVRSPVKIWDRQDRRTKLLVTWTQLNTEEARWMWDNVATQVRSLVKIWDKMEEQNYWSRGYGWTLRRLGGCVSKWPHR